MINIQRIRAMVAAMSLAAGLLAGAVGCGQNSAPPPEIRLARVGSRTITVQDFNRAYEISKTAYSHNEIQDPDLAREVRLRLLNQMIEEAMLLDQAAVHQIDLTREELDAALADIRKDYPEDSFDQMLLESAISFADWKQMLSNRLLIQKLIDHVLGENIVITPQEIRAYYRQHDDGTQTPSAEQGQGEGGGDSGNEIIIAQLRRQKIERAYKEWLGRLNQQYAVEINTAQWQAMTGSTRTGFQPRRVEIQDNSGDPVPKSHGPVADTK